jgi:hypothetical protein
MYSCCISAVEYSELGPEFERACFGESTTLDETEIRFCDFLVFQAFCFFIWVVNLCCYCAADLTMFKNHLRDFLVQTKQFKSSDNSAMFAEVGGGASAESSPAHP